MINALSRYLSPQRLERIVCLDETESTNTYLKSMPALPEGQCVIARRQSGGRGRMGRSFSSPEGGVYLSLLYRFSAPPMAFTACAALAVRRAISAVCGLEAGIKWVNDLIISGKKVCGILAELHGDALILGVGINVNACPADLPNATSLAQAAGREFEVAELAAAVIMELDALAGAYPQCSARCREEYASACLNIGREVMLIHGERSINAFAEGIDEDFSLLLRHSDGRRESVFFGEVSLRNPDGSYI